ncbi:MAG TPA: DoxX family protein [Puia sp.]|nr:DoxX family protein [Puia sp.]
MKKTKILYLIFTGLFAFLMLGSAIPDILSMSDAVKGMHDGLGYPLYFIPFIGVAKVLGVIAILIPGSPRVKEWAYAGLSFDLIGASFSIIAAGQGPGAWGFMIVPLLLAGASYTFYHKFLEKTQANILSNQKVSYIYGKRLQTKITNR